MIEIGKTIAANALFEKEFVCDLSRCKGACCIEGDGGAPLTPEECKVLEAISPVLLPFLRPVGVEAIEKQGAWLTDDDGDLVTPLIQGKECAYVVFDAAGTALCGIEKAHKAGAVDFKKPLSCHLYPVRVTRYSEFDALNVHQWTVCSPACRLGESLKVPVYVFLKEPLIRAYGEAWYQEVEKVAEVLNNSQK